MASSKSAKTKKIAREVDEILAGHVPGRRGVQQAARVLQGPEALALLLRTVSAAPSSERFGVKVFIYPLWERTRDSLGMDLPEFQRWLLEQNRKGNLTLARADLIGAMNREMVSLSELKDRGSAFHFVLDPNGPGY